jgi:hypothetical protein
MAEKNQKMGNYGKILRAFQVIRGIGGHCRES